MDNKKNVKDNLYLLLAFFPIINCMAFFHMYGHVQKKKYSVLAWFSLALNLILFIGMILVPFIENPNERPYYSDIVPFPEVVDFMNDEQFRKYNMDSSYSYSDEFKQSDEYMEYTKACDQHYKDLREWEKSPEIAPQIEVYQAFNDTRTTAFTVLGVVFSVFNFIIIILVFAERPRYMEAYKKAQNKNLFTQRINNTSSVAYDSTAYNSAVPNSTGYILTANNTSDNSVSAMERAVDVNSAPEDEISKIPGLTVIDAKRAVEYRTQNGGFKTKDEFFSVINAKPHIIAHADRYVIVVEIKHSEPAAHNNVKRRIDI